MTDEEQKNEEAEKEERQECLSSAPRWRPASEPTCCGSGCDDCPF